MRRFSSQVMLVLRSQQVELHSMSRVQMMMKWGKDAQSTRRGQSGTRAALADQIACLPTFQTVYSFTGQSVNGRDVLVINRSDHFPPAISLAPVCKAGGAWNGTETRSLYRP